MIRPIVAALVLAASVTAVAAQQDPIAERKALMKGNGQQAAAGAAMVKGEAPFDLAKAKGVFAAIEGASGKIAALFPPTSKTGGDTLALPKIWDSKADFDARAAKLGTDAKAAGESVKDLDTFKAAFGGVMKNCVSCHEEYRMKK